MKISSCKSVREFRERIAVRFAALMPTQKMISKMREKAREKYFESAKIY
jgi:hypothetical protein